MTELSDPSPHATSVFVTNPSEPRPSVMLTAALISAIWGVLSLGLVVYGVGESALRPPQILVVLFFIMVPIVLIWVGAALLRLLHHIQDEASRSQAAFEAFCELCATHSKQTAAATKNTIGKRLDEIADAQQKLEHALAELKTLKPAPQSPSNPNSYPSARAPILDGPTDNQGDLGLSSPVRDQIAPLENIDYTRALNFPENTEDAEGFAALHRVLKDRKSAQLIQAAQDMLTLMSQDGIYMDDLRPDRARPEIWRRFAAGERGRTMAALGGVRDRAALALATVRLKQDPIFRDSTHHFLRLFDKMFVEFEGTATDSDISALSNTRTARAFMLLGRVAGTFD
ncbi:MAG: hypothetical protein P8M25_02835 [Paracoccaceae bacterium]|nr:hypothetical protein [Paracoccaceae bacterium]